MVFQKLDRRSETKGREATQGAGEWAKAAEETQLTSKTFPSSGSFILKYCSAIREDETLSFIVLSSQSEKLRATRPHSCVGRKTETQTRQVGVTGGRGGGRKGATCVVTEGDLTWGGGCTVK